MAVPQIFGLLSAADPSTKAFIARILAVCLGVGFISTVAGIIVLAVMGKEIPTQLTGLLFAITGGTLFGTGSHSATSEVAPMGPNTAIGT